MNLKDQFQGKTVMPVFASGGFAMTPIIRAAENENTSLPQPA